MRPPLSFLLTLALPAAATLAAEFIPASQSFQQEVARHFTSAQGLPATETQLIALAPDGTPRAFAGGKWSELRAGTWRELPSPAPKSGGEFVFAEAGGELRTVPLPAAEVIQLLAAGPHRFIASARKIVLFADGRFSQLSWSIDARINQLATSPTGELHVASAAGLFRRTDRRWEALHIPDGLGRVWAAEDVLGVAFDAQGQLWFATKAGVGCRTPDGWRFREGKDGLPWNEFTCLAAGTAGDMWFGTRRGAIRWDGRDFHYRQGPRWLPHDDVRQIAVDPAGNAWFATAGGVGSIERRPMTLAAKAEFYEEEIERYVLRTPYGYVSGAPLKTAADKSTAQPVDSDNDGLWTAMYGAGECFAYAATGDAKAKERATRAFEALRFLQQVTQGGAPAPPRGYVARTIRSTDGPDPNVGRIERDLAEKKTDVLWKVYEPRWPKSADGRWYWKSDTSSDELDGHYFFYPLYYDLVASTAAEKERVREVVRALTDHLVTHGFNLIDHDGQPTRWGIYAPESLNHDPQWWAERGLKSLSLLAYLAVARHVTGDAKYDAVARDLIARHGYAQNLMFPKVQFGPGSGNQSDDEMAFMCFYSLLRYSHDSDLKYQVRAAWYPYWQYEAPELNPFFNFAYAAQATDQLMRNPWGKFPVAPRGAWHAESMATLRGFPLDRLNWPHQNSHRLDLVPLGGVQSRDFYEPTDQGRGHRVTGRVLPVENRHFNHWNTDPWTLDYRGDGRMLGDGTVFLLPYYMGLYHGYIAKP